MHVWALANQKGGTGKTTTAVHLAAALSESGKRVLLIDLDPQAHATLAVGLPDDGELSLLPVLADKAPLARCILAAEAGFHMVPSQARLAEFSAMAERQVYPERRLAEALADVNGRYDWVLIDCPPRAEGVLCANAVRAADTALIVVETGAFSLQGALQAARIVDELSASVEGGLELRFVATMFDRRSRFSRDFLIAMAARFGSMLLDTVIHESVRLREAAALGVPVNRFDPRCRATADFHALAREVTLKAGASSVPLESPSPPLVPTAGLR